MDATAAVTLLGGLGLFLLGIHHLTEGLKGLAGDSLRRALQRLVAGRFSAVAFGALFTVAIQSSTAATLTVIGFVSAGLTLVWADLALYHAWRLAESLRIASGNT
jgi:phosphate:Na+ symporter